MELIALLGGMAVAEWLMPYKSIHGAGPWIRLQALRLGLMLVFLIVALLIAGNTLSLFWSIVLAGFALASLLIAAKL